MLLVPIATHTSDFKGGGRRRREKGIDNRTALASKGSKDGNSFGIHGHAEDDDDDFLVIVD